MRYPVLQITGIIFALYPGHIELFSGIHVRCEGQYNLTASLKKVTVFTFQSINHWRITFDFKSMYLGWISSIYYNI